MTGAKTTDQGVKNAMFKALYEVVSKAGSNMNESSRNAILGLIDSDAEEPDGKTYQNTYNSNRPTNSDPDATSITNARLLGALIKTLPTEVAANLIKYVYRPNFPKISTNSHTRARVLTTDFSNASVLALNAVLLDSPEVLAESFMEDTTSVIAAGISSSVSFLP